MAHSCRDINHAKCKDFQSAGKFGKAETGMDCRTCKGCPQHTKFLRIESNVSRRAKLNQVLRRPDPEEAELPVFKSDKEWWD